MLLNHIKKLAATAHLCHKIDFFIVDEHLVQPDDIWVIELLQHFYFFEYLLLNVLC